jgi:DNA-binding response OmpR family regulator
MSEDEVTILLVEDNADDEELCVRALRRSHIKNEIVVAHDGVEAVEYLLDQNACDRPHLVLLDLKLPRLDGLQVLERLRADVRTHTTPVVVLTTSDEQRDLVESYDLGANSYIRKPVDFSQFSEAIRAIGVYWLSLNRQPPVPSRLQPRPVATG